MTKKDDLKDILKELENIVNWFENQKDLNLEEGLEKFKIAVNYLKEAKLRLKEVKNEFIRIKKELEEEDSGFENF